MNFRRWCNILLILIFPVFYGNTLFCQVIVSGSVYDMSKTRPLEGVSVLTTSGRGTTTNNLGNYSIVASDNDSIYFSYLTKSTMRFPVATITNFNAFDISLHVQSNILPEVTVMPPSYKFDSLQNRLDYAKAFNYRKPGLGITSSPAGGAGVGLDLDQLINAFRFRKNKSMLGFQRRLIQEEEDKFVDHRFNKIIVRKLTPLREPDLSNFMKMFRPSYEFTLLTNEYEFYDYIKQSYRKYRTVFLPGRNPTE